MTLSVDSLQACRETVEYAVGSSVLGLLVLSVCIAIVYFFVRGVIATFRSEGARHAE